MTTHLPSPSPDSVILTADPEPSPPPIGCAVVGPRWPVPPDAVTVFFSVDKDAQPGVVALEGGAVSITWTRPLTASSDDRALAALHAAQACRIAAQKGATCVESPDPSRQFLPHVELREVDEPDWFVLLDAAARLEQIQWLVIAHNGPGPHGDGGPSDRDAWRRVARMPRALGYPAPPPADVLRDASRAVGELLDVCDPPAVDASIPWGTSTPCCAPRGELTTWVIAVPRCYSSAAPPDALQPLAAGMEATFGPPSLAFASVGDAVCRNVPGGVIIYLVSRETFDSQSSRDDVRACISEAAEWLKTSPQTVYADCVFASRGDRRSWNGFVAPMICRLWPASTTFVPPQEDFDPMISRVAGMLVPRWLADDAIPSTLVVDVVAIGAPLTTWIGDLTWLPDWVDTLIVAVDTDKLVPGRRTPPSEGRRVHVPRPTSTVRPCKERCTTCSTYDSLYARFGPKGNPDDAGPAAASAFIRLASALARDEAWWPHQPSVLGGLEVDSTRADAAPRDDVNKVLEHVLQKIAASPPPPQSRVPRPRDYASDAVSRVRLPWASYRRPLHLVTSSTDGPNGRVLLEALMDAVAAGHAIVTPRSAARCSHLLFVIEQHGKFRPVVDMCGVSTYLTASTVNYPSASDLLSRGCVCGVKVDVWRAFRGVALAAEDWPYCAVIIDAAPDVAFLLTVVWFGINHGPQLWDGVAERATAGLVLRSGEGDATCVRYVDDFGIAAETETAACVAMLTLLVRLLLAGLAPSVPKSFHVPAKKLKFLGCVADFPAAELHIAQSSAAKTAELCREIVAATQPDAPVTPRLLKILRSMLGKLAFYRGALPWVSLLRVNLNRVEPIGRWFPAALDELHFLTLWLPTCHTLTHSRRPVLPILAVIFDASGPTAGAAWWIIVGLGWSRLGFGSVDLVAAGFDPAELDSSAAFEGAVLTAAALAARRRGFVWGWLIALGDPRALIGCITRQRDATVRMSSRSVRVAAVLRRLHEACTFGDVTTLITGIWHSREDDAARIADAASDCGSALWALTPRAVDDIRSLIRIDVDLLATSELTATNPGQWCIGPGGSRERQSMISTLLSLRDTGAMPPWPRPAADVSFARMRAFWLLWSPLAEMAMAAWLPARFSREAHPNAVLWLAASVAHRVAWTSMSTAMSGWCVPVAAVAIRPGGIRFPTGAPVAPDFPVLAVAFRPTKGAARPPDSKWHQRGRFLGADAPVVVCDETRDRPGIMRMEPLWRVRLLGVERLALILDRIRIVNGGRDPLPASPPHAVAPTDEHAPAPSCPGTSRGPEVVPLELPSTAPSTIPPAPDAGGGQHAVQEVPGTPPTSTVPGASLSAPPASNAHLPAPAASAPAPSGAAPEAIPPTSAVPGEQPTALVTSAPPLALFDYARPGDLLMHCISADWRMGLGVALECRTRFGRPPEAAAASVPVGHVTIQRTDDGPTIAHLVTKATAPEKPRLADIVTAVKAATRFAADDGEVRRVLLPRIGCGADGLSWDLVGPVVVGIVASAGKPVVTFDGPPQSDLHATPSLGGAAHGPTTAPAVAATLVTAQVRVVRGIRGGMMPRHTAAAASPADSSIHGSDGDDPPSSGITRAAATAAMACSHPSSQTSHPSSATSARTRASPASAAGYSVSDEPGQRRGMRRPRLPVLATPSSSSRTSSRTRPPSAPSRSSRARHRPRLVSLTARRHGHRRLHLFVGHTEVVPRRPLTVSPDGSWTHVFRRRRRPPSSDDDSEESSSSDDSSSSSDSSTPWWERRERATRRVGVRQSDIDDSDSSDPDYTTSSSSRSAPSTSAAGSLAPAPAAPADAAPSARARPSPRDERSQIHTALRRQPSERTTVAAAAPPTRRVRLACGTSLDGLGAAGTTMSPVSLSSSTPSPPAPPPPPPVSILRQPRQAVAAPAISPSLSPQRAQSPLPSELPLHTVVSVAAAVAAAISSQPHSPPVRPPFHPPPLSWGPRHHPPPPRWRARRGGRGRSRSAGSPSGRPAGAGAGGEPAPRAQRGLPTSGCSRRPPDHAPPRPPAAQVGAPVRHEAMTSSSASRSPPAPTLVYGAAAVARPPMGPLPGPRARAPTPCECGGACIMCEPPLMGPTRPSAGGAAPLARPPSPRHPAAGAGGSQATHRVAFDLRDSTGPGTLTTSEALSAGAPGSAPYVPCAVRLFGTMPAGMMRRGGQQPARTPAKPAPLAATYAPSPSSDLLRVADDDLWAVASVVIPPDDPGTGGALPAPTTADWPPIPCANACGRTIGSEAPARFCDNLACDTGWAVCRLCVPASCDARPLLCPRHQVFATAPPSVAEGAAFGALAAVRFGTVSWWLLRILARCEGATGSALRALHPQPSDPVEDDPDDPTDEVWTDARKRRYRPVASRALDFARAAGYANSPARPFESFGIAFARARISAPLESWRKGCVTARTAADDMSALAEATRLDQGITVPAYLGKRVDAYLSSRGSREREGHTRAFPVTLHDLYVIRHSVPDAHRQAYDAAVVQGFFALRGGMPPLLQREMFSRSGAGWALRWTRRTKVRRGDRLAADPVLSPQFCVVESEWLDEVMARLPTAGLLFPGMAKGAVNAMLRTLIPTPPPGFVMRAHGIRAGTATALRALQVPTDVIRAWGWWARERGADGHYAALMTNVMRTASRRLHLVVLRRESPGFVELVSAGTDPVPDWSAVLRAAPGATSHPGQACRGAPPSRGGPAAGAATSAAAFFAAAGSPFASAAAPPPASLPESESSSDAPFVSAALDRTAEEQTAPRTK